MRLQIAGRPHLTYCTNIHPGETLPEVRRNLERFVLPVKARVSPHQSFGVGLRLAAGAASELCEPAPLDAMRAFLKDHGLYVFTINGFPYGQFHQAEVKERVYLPDWLEDDRLVYANRLAEILAALLEDAPVREGSISTVPGAFKSRIRSDQDVARLSSLLLRHTAFLMEIHAKTGCLITCALEPEPCCFLETSEETVAFFLDHLFSAAAVADLSQMTGRNRSDAEAGLRRHLTVCLDACHAAVQYEDADDLVARLQHAGIRIGKIQLSTGLAISRMNAEMIHALSHYAESIYLHQVIERTGHTLSRYVDLPDAIRAWTGRGRDGESDREWRIHFHVPVFLQQLGLFQNTQPFLARLLHLAATQSLSPHLEVETYTWDMLPEEHRSMPVVEAISRELDWVTKALTA